jgi:hypothetical protein
VVEWIVKRELVGRRTIVEVVNDPGLGRAVPAGELDASGRVGPGSGDLDVEADGVELRARRHCARALWVPVGGELQGDEFVADDVLAWLDVARDGHGPGVVLCYHSVGCPRVCHHIETRLVDFEELKLLRLCVGLGQRGHVRECWPFMGFEILRPFANFSLALVIISNTDQLNTI